jgi:2-keto-4-pentenoate hydratase/2-oxohepta-3-ene-1,7-dioic acid hydratase in catechol pathway
MASSGAHGFKIGKFASGSKTFMGIVKGETVIETNAECLMDALEGKMREEREEHSLRTLRVLAPVDRPSKIICIGLNYRSHIREMNWETPKIPVIFTKPSSAIIGPEDSIEIPAVSGRVDFEGESAIIIGGRARKTSEGTLHIFGYTCFNDVTARDLQKGDVDWTRAKGFDTFAPIGPFISSKAPTRVTTRLNGKVAQDSALSDRVFGDAALVEYISSIMTLEPGDVIATGTPSGIAPMKPGDVVEVELDGIGRLRNSVKTGP